MSIFKKDKPIEHIKQIAEDKVNRIKIKTETETSIITNQIENENKIDKLMYDKYKNEIDKIDMIEKIDRMKLQYKQVNSVSSKAWIFNCISVVCIVISAFMTVLGINNVTTIEQLKQILYNPSSLLYSTLVLVTQIIIFIASANSTYLKSKFYSTYKYIHIFIILMIGVSFLGNFKFLDNYIKPHGLDYIFIIIPSLALDCFSILFSNLANDTKYRNYSFSNDIKSNVNFITMLYRMWILPQKIKRKKAYDNILNEYKNLFENNEEKTEKKAEQFNVNESLECVAITDLTEEKTEEKNIIFNANLKQEKEPKEAEKTEKENIIFNDNLTEEKSETKDNILNFQTEKENKIDKKLYAKILKKLCEINVGDKVSNKTLGLNITPAQWRKYKNILEQQNLITVNGTNSYKLEPTKTEEA